MTYKTESLQGTQHNYFPLSQVGDLSKVPVTVKILIEQMVRAAAIGGAAEKDIAALAKYPAAPPERTAVPFRPTRILLQDFTGVPAVVDLAAMREAIDRHFADTGRYPESLEDLAAKKYLRSVAADPITDSSKTWILVPPERRELGGVFDVHSGAPGKARDGSAYKDW